MLIYSFLLLFFNILYFIVFIPHLIYWRWRWCLVIIVCNPDNLSLFALSGALVTVAKFVTKMLCSVCFSFSAPACSCSWGTRSCCWLWQTHVSASIQKAPGSDHSRLRKKNREPTRLAEFLKSITALFTVFNLAFSSKPFSCDLNYNNDKSNKTITFSLNY